MRAEGTQADDTGVGTAEGGRDKKRALNRVGMKTTKVGGSKGGREHFISSWAYPFIG